MDTLFELYRAISVEQPPDRASDADTSCGEDVDSTDLLRLVNHNNLASLTSRSCCVNVKMSARPTCAKLAASGVVVPERTGTPFR